MCNRLLHVLENEELLVELGLVKGREGWGLRGAGWDVSRNLRN
jgi:hypothetical protein